VVCICFYLVAVDFRRFSFFLSFSFLLTLFHPSQLPSAHCLFKSRAKRSGTPFCPQTPGRVFLGCNAWEGSLLGLGCTTSCSDTAFSFFNLRLTCRAPSLITVEGVLFFNFLWHPPPFSISALLLFFRLCSLICYLVGILIGRKLPLFVLSCSAPSLLQSSFSLVSCSLRPLSTRLPVVGGALMTHFTIAPQSGRQIRRMLESCWVCVLTACPCTGHRISVLWLAHCVRLAHTSL
jgi:hypothetical protein